MIIPQLVVLWLIADWGHMVAAALVSVLIAGQLLTMLRFLTNPRRLAPWYNGVGVTQYVAGMMVSALAMGGHFG
jgi:chlorophyll synthase